MPSAVLAPNSTFCEFKIVAVNPFLTVTSPVVFAPLI